MDTSKIKINQEKSQVKLYCLGLPPRWLVEGFSDLQVINSDLLKEIVLSDRACVVVICSESFDEAYKISKTLSRASLLKYFVYLEKWEATQIEQLYEFSNFKAPLSSGSYLSHVNHIKLEIDKIGQKLTASQRKASFSQELRLLEKLNKELEIIVEDRTQIFEESKSEEEQRLAQTRGIIKSIQEMAQILAIEDLLVFLKRELKIFHGLGEVIYISDLNYNSKLKKIQWHSKEQMHSVQGQLELLKQDSEEIRIVSSLELSGLTKVFQRPFGSGILVVLDSRKGRFILIESLISENELPKVIQFLSDRRLPLSLTVDRLLIEREIESSIASWEASFDSVQDSLAIISKTYEVARSNHAFEKNPGNKCFEILLNRKEPCENCPISLQTKENRIISNKNQTFELFSNPLIIDDLPQVSYYSIHLYRDRSHARELAARVLQSEKMAALGELSAHIAHELNNPLTGIRSMAQVMLNDAQVPQEIKEDLKQIESGTDRAQKIIDNLMRFTKGQTGTLTQVTMQEVVESTLPFLKTALRDHHYHVSHILNQSSVLAELPLLQQVFFNIVNNASQAMTKSGELWIETGELKIDNKLFCFFEVKDTGPGINIELRQKVFEPLFTTKPEGSGTGLGLALSKKIVESFGGKISIEDSKVGAHLRVAFPVEKGSN